MIVIYYHCSFVAFTFFFGGGHIQHTWDLGSSIRDQTHAPCNGNMEVLSLDHQGSPIPFTFTGFFTGLFYFLIEKVI